MIVMIYFMFKKTNLIKYDMICTFGQVPSDPPAPEHPQPLRVFVGHATVEEDHVACGATGWDSW